MRRFLFLLSLVCFVPTAHALDIWTSTNTATIDVTKSLCRAPNTTSRGRGVVHNVCVNTGVAGTFTIYNSSATTANPMAAIDTAAKGCMEYDVALASGVTYSNSATANVTLTYACY